MTDLDITELNNLEKILYGLMSRYIARVPDVSKITKALIDNDIIKNQEDIKNDHIAFRTLGIPELGISSLEKIFLHYGYISRDDYFFENKRVNAKWYSPPKDHLPRIFISELIVNDFSEELQKIIKSYTNNIKSDPVDTINLNDPKQVDNYLHSALWQIPSLDDYKKLLEVSEYAAWVIYNRYYLNHYTISVDELSSEYNTLDKFNLFLKSIGIKLSDAGGYIKESKDGLLLQSSSVSNMCEAIFSDGDKYSIAGSYVEFSERRILPEFRHLPKSQITRIHRREGFETSNADKIFESTFTSQTKKEQKIGH